MQQTLDFSRPLFCGAAAQTAEGQESAMNAVNPSTAPRLSHQLNVASLFHPGRELSFPCDRRGELRWIQRGENMDDFFATADLLAQAYEDAVYAQLIPA